MATAPANRHPTATTAPSSQKSRRRNTSHLKLVPETLAMREQLRAYAIETAAKLDKSRPLSKDEMEAVARRLLQETGQPEGYLGWTMVALVSAFWEDQLAAIPPSRRLFLLPHCLKHAEGCPADYDDFGLECKKCGACSIADFRAEAEERGYKVLVAEGSPIVLKIIVSGYVDAIVGVACLNVLEKALDKILLAGIPCMAVPLLSSDCRNTSVDEEWVTTMIRTEHREPSTQTRSYVHLMRAAEAMFAPDELARLAPRIRSQQTLTATTDGLSAFDPLAGTEALAHDFLAKGGKHSRPFITLAVYDALTGSQGTSGDGAAHIAGFSDAVRRTALSIETFHKASLVHDDIEDDDGFRYGDPTLHRKYGIPTAINVGDYMIGLGYRLVSREVAALGADIVADILNHLADAHTRLSEGQGAELLWRSSPNKQLTPLDALKIYALKTSPAFGAALYAGVRLAGDATEYAEPFAQFAKHLGVAFQILNDLDDWELDSHNKLSAGGDILGGRPTILWALALEALDQTDRERLATLVGHTATPALLAEVRELYQKARVFEKAQRLIEKYQERAEAIADEIQPDALRQLLYYLVDSVLEQPSHTPAVVGVTTIHSVLPTATPS